MYWNSHFSFCFSDTTCFGATFWACVCQLMFSGREKWETVAGGSVGVCNNSRSGCIATCCTNAAVSPTASLRFDTRVPSTYVETQAVAGSSAPSATICVRTDVRIACRTQAEHGSKFSFYCSFFAPHSTSYACFIFPTKVLGRFVWNLVLEYMWSLDAHPYLSLTAPTVRDALSSNIGLSFAKWFVQNMAAHRIIDPPNTWRYTYTPPHVFLACC
jgi:hypothetical protein